MNKLFAKAQALVRPAILAIGLGGMAAEGAGAAAVTTAAATTTATFGTTLGTAALAGGGALAASACSLQIGDDSEPARPIAVVVCTDGWDNYQTSRVYADYCQDEIKPDGYSYLQCYDGDYKANSTYRYPSYDSYFDTGCWQDDAYLGTLSAKVPTTLPPGVKIESANQNVNTAQQSLMSSPDATNELVSLKPGARTAFRLDAIKDTFKVNSDISTPEARKGQFVSVKVAASELQSRPVRAAAATPGAP